MKLKIKELNGYEKEYKIKYDIEARLKMAGKIDTLEKAKNGDIEAIISFVFNCLKKYKNSFEHFLKIYPALENTALAFAGLMTELLREATNPYNLIIPQDKKKLSIDKSEEKKLTHEEYMAQEHKILYEMIYSLMGMGHKYTEILNMTHFEIELIFKADHRKLEREAIHTNTIINTVASAAGYKGKPLNMLKTNDLEDNEENQAMIGIADILRRKREAKEREQAENIANEVGKGVIDLCNQ